MKKLITNSEKNLNKRFINFLIIFFISFISEYFYIPIPSYNYIKSDYLFTVEILM